MYSFPFKFRSHHICLFFIFAFVSCKLDSKKIVASQDNQVEEIIPEDSTVLSPPLSPDYDTLLWKEITDESGAMLDIRYATENNFTKKQIYDCARCFLRPIVAKKLLTLQKDINSRYGMSIKLFDCYRPRPAQQKLWDIVPDARYVTPPSKGSMHNRGLAVDLTLVDKNGEELDMGTEYDFFGREAYTDNKNLPEDILRNRNILKTMMKLHGLKGIRTEWWHYSLKTGKADFDDWEWDCK